MRRTKRRCQRRRSANASGSARAAECRSRCSTPPDVCMRPDAASNAGKSGLRRRNAACRMHPASGLPAGRGRLLLKAAAARSVRWRRRHPAVRPMMMSCRSGTQLPVHPIALIVRPSLPVPKNSARRHSSRSAVRSGCQRKTPSGRRPSGFPSEPYRNDVALVYTFRSGGPLRLGVAATFRSCACGAAFRPPRGQDQ